VTEPVQLEANKALCRRLWEVYLRDYDASSEIAAPRYTLHMNGMDIEMEPGSEVHRMQFDAWANAFSDIRITVVNQVAEGDMVAEHIRFEGAHTGISFMGVPASGKTISFTQTHIHRIEDGRIIETWENFDELAFYRQLGVPPAGS
jgi:predicted ester cyclase